MLPRPLRRARNGLFVPAPDEGGGSFTTLDAAKKSANGTLSGGNLIVTGGGQGTVLALAPCVATKTCAEITLTDDGSAGNNWWGVATADSDYGNGSWAGSSPQKSGSYRAGLFVLGSAHHDDELAGLVPAEGDKILLEVDYSQTVSTLGAAPQGCWRQRMNGMTGLWWPLPLDSDDAAAPVYIAVGYDTGDVMAVNFGAAPFTNTPTAGFVGIAA